MRGKTNSSVIKRRFLLNIFKYSGLSNKHVVWNKNGGRKNFQNLISAVV